MNHKLWAAAGARVIAVSFILATAAACGERLSDTSAKSPSPNPTSPSAVVIGQAPAEPQSETAQTTSPAGAQGVLSKAQESASRPMEGDNHSYSTLAPTTPQKADGVNQTGDGERKTQ